MALKTCKQCGGQVATTAKACPHCGARNPLGRIGCFKLGCVLLVVVFLFGLFMTMLNTDYEGSLNRGTAPNRTEPTVRSSAIRERLSYLDDIPEVAGWKVQGRRVYIALSEENIPDLSMIAGAAAAFASKASGGTQVEAVMLSAAKAGPTWDDRPNVDREAVTCSAIARNGTVTDNGCNP